uniref:Uncharacterized protein n=1 Tax=Arundo donax TaxID=35708 RepID=A0A0A9DFD5_ARUDO
MSPHPSRRSSRKLPITRGPSRARAARIAFHLGSPPLCGFPPLPPPAPAAVPLLQPLPSLAALLLTLVLALRLVTVQLGAMLVTVAAAPELSMLLCGLAPPLGVGDTSHEITGLAGLSRPSTAMKTVSISSTGSGGWLAPEKELLGDASPSPSSSLDAMLILTLSNSNPRTFSVNLTSPFLRPPPPTPTPPIWSSNTSGTNRNWKSWYLELEP